MRISIETSKPHLVKELFKCMTKSHELQELENEELEDGQNCDFLHKNEPSFAELLNYMRLLWTSDNSVYVNVIYNIVEAEGAKTTIFTMILKPLVQKHMYLR